MVANDPLFFTPESVAGQNSLNRWLSCGNHIGNKLQTDSLFRLWRCKAITSRQV